LLLSFFGNALLVVIWLLVFGLAVLCCSLSTGAMWITGTLAATTLVLCRVLLLALRPTFANVGWLFIGLHGTAIEWLRLEYPRRCIFG